MLGEKPIPVPLHPPQISHGLAWDRIRVYAVRGRRPECHVKGKSKSVPLQAWSGPEGSRKLRFPDFMKTSQDVGRLSALRTGRLYPRKCSWYSFLLEAESTPGPQCDRKDFMSMKNPLTPAGIEPATFRFVAQHFNHCATAVP